jgi:hypothetical protein
MKKVGEEIPQIISITRISKSGEIGLAKSVREYLSATKSATFDVDLGPEILLRTVPIGEGKAPGQFRIAIPDEALRKLDMRNNAEYVACIERDNAVALKRVEVAEIGSEHARYVDKETPFVVIRTLETNPLPDKLLPRLKDEVAECKFEYGLLLEHLRKTESYCGWVARTIIGLERSDDDALRLSYIASRIKAQAKNGSWDDDIILTARNLRELHQLGHGPESPEIQKGAEWILRRNESEANPGMFFGTDELVVEQAKVQKERASGVKSRFRQIKTSEKKRIIAGDDLIIAPCGPRIMWPNALSLEALLLLGYESHPRLQTVLESLGNKDWCECGYQNGSEYHQHSIVANEESLADFEALCIRQYRYGGISSPDYLLKEADRASRSHTLRVAEQAMNGETEYELRMPDHIQGCEFITTRALAYVTDAALRRFAEAHLWRFAGIQRSDGTFPKERYGTGFGQIGILDAVSRHDHPASKVMVLRALPRLLSEQNDDGSWGTGADRDISTLGVVRALASLGDLLPNTIAVSMRLQEKGE